MMKRPLVAGLLVISSQAFALDLTIGLGTCNAGGDYCPDPVGKIGLTQEIWISNRHAVQIEAFHLSEIGDGEPGSGDRGSEFLFIEYKVNLR